MRSIGQFKSEKSANFLKITISATNLSILNEFHSMKTPSMQSYDYDLVGCAFVWNESLLFLRYRCPKIGFSLRLWILCCVDPNFPFQHGRSLWDAVIITQTDVGSNCLQQFWYNLYMHPKNSISFLVYANLYGGWWASCSTKWFGQKSFSNHAFQSQASYTLCLLFCAMWDTYIVPTSMPM